MDSIFQNLSPSQLLNSLYDWESLSKEEQNDLKNITELDLSEMSIKNFPKALGQLTNLQALNLRDNQLAEFPEFIGQLTNLQVLYLSGNQLTEFPEFIGQLTNLQALYLSRNQLTEFPEFIGQLTNLQELNLRGNQLTQLPKNMEQLTKLLWLNLSKNQFFKFPESLITLMTQACFGIDFSGMMITEIPDPVLTIMDKVGAEFSFDEYFGSWRNKDLNIKNTLFKTQPESLFHQDWTLIKAYAESTKTILHDAKVIFLGDGGAGKTHTIERILNEGKKLGYDTPTTDGINISRFDVKNNESELSIRFWDFGGQEIYHSMHRCFLTDRCLYVIIIANRDNAMTLTQRAEYWLNNLASFAPDCPVLLAVNKIDENPNTVLDMDYLKKIHSGLIDPYLVYNAKGVGAAVSEINQAKEFSHFTNTIISEALELDSVGMKFPIVWNNILNELTERSKSEYILKNTDFHQICTDYGENNTEIRKWLLEWFNDLGICFSYHIDQETGKELDDYRILNPEWLTNAIYIIINAGKSKALNGVLNKDTILSLLNDNTIDDKLHPAIGNVIYENQHIEFILQILRKYYLSYPVKQDYEFFPGILNEKIPVNFKTTTYSKKLSYQLVYKYLPDNVVHQLMVRLYKYLNLEKSYNRGFRIDFDEFVGMSAVLDMGHSNKTLDIDIFYSQNEKPFRLIRWISKMIDEVNESVGIEKPKQYIKAEYEGQEISIPLPKILLKKALNQHELTDYDETLQTVYSFNIDDLLGEICTEEEITVTKEIAEVIIPTQSDKRFIKITSLMEQIIELLQRGNYEMDTFVQQQDRISGKLDTVINNQLTDEQMQKYWENAIDKLKENSDDSLKSLIDTLEKKDHKTGLQTICGFLSSGGSNLANAITIGAAIGPLSSFILTLDQSKNLAPKIVEVLKIMSKLKLG